MSDSSPIYQKPKKEVCSGCAAALELLNASEIVVASPDEYQRFVVEMAVVSVRAAKELLESCTQCSGQVPLCSSQNDGETS